MAYTTINKSTEHFNTKLFTGNGSTNAVTGVGFQPDWTWIKNRTDSASHNLYDAVRGTSAGKLKTNSTAAESYNAQDLSVFGTDGFTVGGNNEVNGSSDDMVSWNWKAGGATPAITYAVKVVSDSGNKFRFDDFGSSAVTLDLQEGGVYTFDQSDSSNSGHPLRFSTTSDGTHGGGSAYTTGVVVSGTPGNAGAKTVITVAASAPTLYYYCSNHSGMGGQANTNSTFGSSNFKGSIQSTVSANTTAGFSVVSYTANGVQGATVGHGLSSAPEWVFTKDRDATGAWGSYHKGVHPTSPEDYYVELNSNSARADFTYWNDAKPSNTVVTIGNAGANNTNGRKIIMFCFHSVNGFSKFGYYNGNANLEGPFVYTGFKPTFFIHKRAAGGNGGWYIYDNKRGPVNEILKTLKTEGPEAEDANADYNDVDFLSNGVKIREDNNDINASGDTYIYIAFGQSLVGSNNVPVTAR